MFTIILSAQEQYKRIFDHATITDVDGKIQTIEATNIFYFNYRNENVIKAYLSSGEIIYFEELSELTSGVTSANLPYKYIFVKEQNKDDMLIIQIFDDEQYGIQLIDVEKKYIIVQLH